MIAPLSSGTSFSDTKAVRDFCLPGLWRRDDARGRELDLWCNQNGGIDLVVDGKTHPIFTAKDLSEPCWLGHFNPRIIQILEDK